MLLGIGEPRFGLSNSAYWALRATSSSSPSELVKSQSGRIGGSFSSEKSALQPGFAESRLIILTEGCKAMIPKLEHAESSHSSKGALSGLVQKVSKGGYGGERRSSTYALPSVELGGALPCACTGCPVRASAFAALTSNLPRTGRGLSRHC